MTTEIRPMRTWEQERRGGRPADELRQFAIGSFGPRALLFVEDADAESLPRLFAVAPEMLALLAEIAADGDAPRSRVYEWRSAARDLIHAANPALWPARTEPCQECTARTV
jgi:hypothetical protein